MEKNNFKSGYILIVGETNVGKSSFINRIVGERVSIVTPKVQTTRKNVFGIYTDKSMQVIFIDTPGLHKGKTKLSKIMNEEALMNIDDADLVILVIDVREKNISSFNEKVLNELNKNKKKAILILNKCDLSNDKQIFSKINEYKEKYDFIEFLPLSTKKISDEKRKEILNIIYNNFEIGPKYYDEEEWTNQTIREIVSEKIRSKMLKFLRDEIPHGIYISVDKYEKTKTTKKEDIINIDANIYTAKESHKGIIIGKNGEMLKLIGRTSREDLERELDIKINLQLWVKVQKDWLNNDKFISNFKTKN